jgi:UDP-2-acetamido-2-deoxy-ribo-hexuluronate aminotransferase
LTSKGAATLQRCPESGGPPRDCVGSLFTVFIEPEGGRHRDVVQAALEDRSALTAANCPLPLHHQPAYAPRCSPDGCLVSVAAAQQVLSLPTSADLTGAGRDQVIVALATALRQ